MDETHQLLYKGEKSPVNCLSHDPTNKKLWFATSNDSSLKYIDLAKNRADVGIADYELEGLPWMTEYHLMKNKRYVITNNTLDQP